MLMITAQQQRGLSAFGLSVIRQSMVVVVGFMKKEDTPYITSLISHLHLHLHNDISNKIIVSIHFYIHSLLTCSIYRNSFLDKEYRTSEAVTNIGQSSLFDQILWLIQVDKDDRYGR